MFNPADSEANLFIDNFSVANTSGQYFNAEVWLNAKLPGAGEASSLVHPSNLAAEPRPEPKAQLRYASRIGGIALGGVNPLNRIVPPGTTIVCDSGTGEGGFIIPPGGSIAIFIKSPGPFQYEARIACCWWEETAAAGGSV